MRRTRLIALGSFVLVVGAMGCGNGDAIEMDGTGGSGGAALTHEACPTALPANDAACVEEGLFCTYGTVPYWASRSFATCTVGHWVVYASANDDDPLSNPDWCGASPESSISCTVGGQCLYADGTFCYCYNAETGPDCLPAPSPDCEPFPPNAGTPCPVPQMSCGYDGQSAWSMYTGMFTLSTTCEDGVWTWRIFHLP